MLGDVLIQGVEDEEPDLLLDGDDDKHNRSLDRLIHRSIVRLIDRLTGRSVDRPTDRPIRRSIGGAIAMHTID